MMNGIVRRIDDLGRIVIPKEIRQTLHINDGDHIEIALRNGAITLIPCKLQCACCGLKEEDKLLFVCVDCVNKWGKAVQP